MNEKINICFDLDGPIIDVSYRYYVAYLESLKDTSTNKERILSNEEFWKLKQNRISDLEIGILSRLSINESKSSADLRKGLTFKTDFLAHDKIFDDVYKTFEYLKSHKITFFIVTLRRNKQLNHAVKQFKLDKYINSEFLFSLPDEHKVTNDIQEKYILLVKAINSLQLNPKETWFIGDSETDIHASRLAKCEKTVAITRGIRSKEQLEILQPDYLINDLNELLIISQGIKTN